MHSRYMKKMLSVTNYQGNANQNHNEVSPHICQDGYHYKKKKKQTISVGKYVEKWESLHIISGN